MDGCPVPFRGETLVALPTGAIFWPARKLLCVSDLHLGKTERIARRGGSMLPPYETQETLDRLERDVEATVPEVIVALGDSFDDPSAAGVIGDRAAGRLERMAHGRRWVWIEGNHDPGPVWPGGAHAVEMIETPLAFRHMATSAGVGEISGHYHPKARVSPRGWGIGGRCFLIDSKRMILPAYGTYTGGLFCHEAPLSNLMEPDAKAILLGRECIPVPMPGRRAA